MKVSIKVSARVKRELDRLKEELGFSSYSDVINYLITLHNNELRIYRELEDIRKFFENIGKVLKS